MAEYLVLNLSEQITWDHKLWGQITWVCKMLGQNTSAHFLQKSGADYLGGQITFLVGQNTWARPKVGGRIPN